MKNITIKQSSDLFIKALEVEGLASETIKAYRTDMSIFYTFIKEILNNRVRYVSDLKYHHIEQYKEYLRSKYQMRTSARKFNCFRTYLRKMYANGFIDKCIISSMEEDKFGNRRRDKSLGTSEIRRQILSKDSLNAIITRVLIDKGKNKYRDLALFNILFLGQRRQDILALKWHDFNFTEKTMSIYRKKTNTVDIVMIPDNAVKALKQHYKMCMLTNTLTEQVFSLSTTPYNNVIKKYVQGLVTETGDENITGHTFRHTFVTQMIRQGVDLSIIQQYTGHSLETIQAYTHLSVRDSRKAVTALDNLFS